MTLDDVEPTCVVVVVVFVVVVETSLTVYCKVRS